MKSKTNFLKKFITSIYDLKVFSKYAAEGLSKAILYAMLITVIAGGINGLVIGYRLNESISRINNELNSDKYKCSIQNGILNINKSPIKFEEENGLVYIDKDISINQENLITNKVIDRDINILILKDGIILNNLFDKYKISYDDEIVKNILSINNFNSVRAIGIMSLCIINMIVAFFELLGNSIIIVAILSIITIFMKIMVKYSALYSITLYASTLPLIIKTTLENINTNVNLNTVFIIGTLIYVLFILNYIKHELIEKIKKLKN